MGSVSALVKFWAAFVPILIFSHDSDTKDPEHRMVEAEKASDRMHEELKALSP
jgi:hypothetical protein